ncbi:MAG: TIGR02186 family protein, partial [Devosia sp.]
MRIMFAIVAVLLLATPVAAERLISQVSQSEVSITSSFAGETLTLFGTIEPDVGPAATAVQGPYHVIITVTGPLQNRVARQKTNQFGIWLNTQQIEFRDVPSFYQVVADAPLEEIE